VVGVAVGVLVGGTGVLVGVAVGGGVVGVAVGVVGVGVGVVPLQFVHGGSNVTLRLVNVITGPGVPGVTLLTLTGLTGLKPGEDAFTGFSLTT
jgi:hypothetical protein